MSDRGEAGTVTYVCVDDGTEWEARAVKYPENMDPAVLPTTDRRRRPGDQCPECRRECDNAVDWEPDAGVRT